VNKLLVVAHEDIEQEVLNDPYFGLHSLSTEAISASSPPMSPVVGVSEELGNIDPRLFREKAVRVSIKKS